MFLSIYKVSTLMAFVNRDRSLLSIGKTASGSEKNFSLFQKDKAVPQKVRIA